MATIQDLPLELIQLILVNFRRKRDYTLRACSLLSKSWRAATLPRLFATLRPTRKCGESSPAHVATFLDSHLDISVCVKHLWLRDWYRIDADILRSLLSRLPAVERLSLELTTFGPPLPGLRPLPVEQPADGHLAPPYRLRVMVVNFSELHGDASHLIDILTLCEVETFKVMFLRDAMDNPSFLARLASSPLCVRIQDLILGAQKRVAERCPTGLLRLLRAGMIPGYLRSMEFTCDSWDTLSPAGALLCDVGQNITTFKLKLLGRAMFEKANASADRWRPLQLSACTRLEVFRLDAPHYYLLPAMHDISLFAAYANILRGLPLSVRTIRLRLSGSIETALSDEGRAADIASIERAISDDTRCRFPELEAVVLEFDMVYAAECAALATRLMPRLHDLGLLRAVPALS